MFNKNMADSLEARLKSRAAELGFAPVGIAPAVEADGFDRFESWLDADFAGGMDYLHRRREARRHPRSILTSVRSVVMLGMEYGGMASPAVRQAGRVARYAWGPDYHRVLWDRENELGAWLKLEVPGTAVVGVTDTAPLLERDFARRAGLGWIGKNTMLIDKHRGSFLFLGAILTDVELKPDPPHTATHCGTCTACLDACPTDAFPKPGVLDARKCISYLTIEHRGPIQEDLRPGVGDWLFGCDICQDVCPWNRGEGGSSPFPGDPSLASLDPVEVLGMSEEEYRRRFRATALSRAKRAGLARNAAVVLGNVGGASAVPALERAAESDPDEGVREAARWAVGRIRQRTSKE